MKFRTKPAEVEAFQLTTMNRACIDGWPGWGALARSRQHWEIGAVFTLAGKTMLTLPEGAVPLAHEDWIIRHADGSLTAATAEFFNANYESAEPEQEAPAGANGDDK